MKIWMAMLPPFHLHLMPFDGVSFDSKDTPNAGDYLIPRRTADDAVVRGCPPL